MKLLEILRRAEGNISLMLATTAEIGHALSVATYERHKYPLRRELARRQKPRRGWKGHARTDGMTKIKRKGKCPTKQALK